MSAADAKFKVAIVGDDQTAKAVKSAERRLGTVPKHVSAVNKAAAREIQQATTRSSRGILRTFSAVEQASARALGGRSVTSGLASRLGAVREAAGALGSGLGEAATAGGLLQGTMTAVGVAAAGTVGVLAAAAYGAFRLADGWAKGAAQIGRTSDIIGVATKQLQQFNAAAERQGVDRGTSTGALAGLSQSLNDARYGRNNEAVALLARWGVKLRLRQDGTVDMDAMLPAIANAIAQQNSSGRRTAARILGLPEAALPAFTQGSGALGAAMRDADGTAYIATPGEIATAQRIQGKEAVVGQMKDRAVARAGAAAAIGGEGGLDATIAGGRGLISGTESFGGVVRRSLAPAAEKIEAGGRAIERGAEKLLSAVGLRGSAAKHNNALNLRPAGGGGFRTFANPADSIRAGADQILRDQRVHGARTIEELIAGRVGADGKRHWGWAPASDHNDTAAYVRNVAQRTGFGARQALNFSDPETLAALIHAMIAQENGRFAFSRDEVRQALHVNLHVTGLPQGAKVKATTRGRGAPAVSMALAH